MSEARKVSLRLITIVLIVLNVLFFAYSLLTPDTRKQAGKRIEELQINPARIKLMGSATRGPGGAATSGEASAGTPYRACLEWGPFATADASRAERALARLTLARPALQRPASKGGESHVAYFVRDPDAAIVAQVAELQRAFPGTDIKAGPCP